MELPYYDTQSRIFITEKPIFPPEDELKKCKYTGEDGFVQIQEWKTYFIKFYDSDNASAFNNAPRDLAKKLDNFYEINFRNYTGLTRIGGINLRVDNRKISNGLYESMLSYISDKYERLIFSFGTSTGLEHEKTTTGQDNAYINYLFLKKRLLKTRPNLKEIAALILSEPHKKLLTEERTCMIDEVDSVDSALLVTMFSGALNLAVLAEGHFLGRSALGSRLYNKTGRRLYPGEARKIRRYYSFDTNENRFVKYFLKRLLKTIETIKQALAGSSGTYLNPAIDENCTKLKHEINYLLADPLWNEVGQLTFIPEHSTVLQKRDGYRDIYHLHSLLQRSTRFRFFSKDFRDIIENKDVATLFEFWCFFQVKDILDSRYKATDYTVLVQPDDKEESLTEGLSIEYDQGFSLRYNYSAGGSTGMDTSGHFSPGYKANESYSHSLRPDILIVKNNGEKIIFDAKHKGKNGGGGFYGEEFEGSIESCKEEDLDKMHTYREAIKNVSGAFALFPGTKDVIYPSHNAQGLFQGIGALPLRPVEGGNVNPEHYQRLSEVITDFIEK